jgi:hypothetical protein
MCSLMVSITFHGSGQEIFPERTDQVVGGSNICGEALCCMESFLVSRNGLKSFFLADGRMAQVNTLQQWRVFSCKNWL